MIFAELVPRLVTFAVVAERFPEKLPTKLAAFTVPETFAEAVEMVLENSRGVKPPFRCGLRERYQIETNSEYPVCN